MFSPQGAADWLATRLNRTVSRQTIQAYIQAGNLVATNITPGGKQARWIIADEALEQLAQQISANGGELPIPTGGWPQRPGVKRGIGRGNGQKPRTHTQHTEP